MRKKILLLTTGGTIACTKGTNGYAPTLSGETLLEYVPQVRRYADIQVKALLNKDSTDIVPQDWIAIADAIYTNRSDYDSVVVLHGTDTMAYSASAVSFMTLGVEIPVVFTGSQRPMGQPDSDGPLNLSDAVCTACLCKFGGVFLVFDGTVFNGSRVSKISTDDPHAFESCGCPPVGRVERNTLEITAPPRRDIQAGHTWRRSLDSHVLFLKITPGMDRALLELALKEQYRAVVLEGFGLGGIPDGESGLLEEITALRRQGILVIVTTQCSRGCCDMSVYEAGQKALRHGAICSSVIAKESLLTKLMWCFAQSQNAAQVESLLFHDFCGELAQKSYLH